MTRHQPYNHKPTLALKTFAFWLPAQNAWDWASMVVCHNVVPLKKGSCLSMIAEFTGHCITVLADTLSILGGSGGSRATLLSPSHQDQGVHPSSIGQPIPSQPSQPRHPKHPQASHPQAPQRQVIPMGLRLVGALGWLSLPNCHDSFDFGALDALHFCSRRGGPFSKAGRLDGLGPGRCDQGKGSRCNLAVVEQVVHDG